MPFIGGAWNRPIRTFILTTSRPPSRWGHCYPNTIESGIKEPAGPKIRLPRCGRRDERALGHIHAASRYAADRRIYRTVTQAVCPYHHVPFHFRPPDPWSALDSLYHGIRLRHDRKRDLQGHDPVLGKIVRHQFHPGGHDGLDPGISIRPELVLLRPLWGRYLRRPMSA
jgi:hypothetical protein